ncbi:MAG: filamentous hemagglutinin N-terminal domain-containing protein, partial [Gammaproteobacteria bacterium]|nr:filamentous hemagglutinin N-terminal domain-containing protein [Gammaproteobacteria bacterium]
MKTLLNITLKQICAFAAGAMMMSSAYANPELSNVAIGNATVTQTATTTQVNQASQQAVIDWKSFNIGANESTHFEQPAGGVALNRIDAAQGASQIYGQLSATGKIILVNGAGIYFGPSAMVNVGGLIASTSGISVANFLAGKYVFDQPSNLNGSIVNDGTIRAAAYGLVAFMGASVTNNGLIQAELGSVVLGSGNKFTLDFSGDQLINFAIDEGVAQGAMNPGVKNTGTLLADGGKILVSARAAQGVIDDVINMDGVARAKSVSEHNGVIILSGDSQSNVKVSGIVDVSGAAGGVIKVLGQNVHLTSTANLDASGDLGGGTILVGGNFHGAGPEQNALNTTVDAGAILNANALTSGNGGQVVVWSDGNTQFHGSIFAQGGAQSGDGGSVETSGHYLDVSGAYVNTLAANGLTGNWLLDPTNIFIALNQGNATTAGMTGTDSTANTVNGGTFAGSGAVPDSLLTTGNLVTALGTSSITVTTTNPTGTGTGNITVVDPISWSNANSLTLSATQNIVINAAISNGGTGAVILKADNTGSYNGFAVTGTRGKVTGTGSVTAATGGVSIYYDPTTFGTQDATYYTGGGTAPTHYMLINELGSASDASTVNSLGALSFNIGLRAGSFALGTNIDASATSTWNSGLGFTPIATSGSPFTGSFNGQGYTINNLFMNRGDFTSLGLFSSVSSGASVVISNLGLTNVNITQTSTASNTNTAAVVGIIAGSTTLLSNVWVTGTVQATAGTTPSVGGLVGLINTGTSGSITNSYNAASVSVIAGGFAGGITGHFATGTIQNSYNIGAISTTGAGSFLGGIAGNLCSGCGSIIISGTYNSGSISTTNAPTAGAIVGNNSNLTATSNFFDSGTSGGVSSSGTGAASGTALTTAQMMQSGNFSGWTIATASSSTPSSSTWFLIPGSTRPMLMSEEFSKNTPLTINNAHQLQLMSANTAASYTVGSNINFSTTAATDVWGGAAPNLTVNSNLTLNGNITSTGNQTYNNPVTLGVSATLTSSAGSIALAAINGNGFGLTINNNTASSISGIFSGTGSSLTKSGTGILTLSGANTYTGGTSLNVGTINLGISSTGAITNGPLGTGTLTLNGGTLTANAGPFSIANPYTLAASSIIGGTNSFTLSGAGTLTTGTLTLSNTATTTLSGNLSGAAAINPTAGTTILS